MAPEYKCVYLCVCVVSLKDVHNHKVFHSASFTRGRFPTDSGSIIHVSHGTVCGNQFLIMPIVTLPAGRRREERNGPVHSGGSWHGRYRQSHRASAVSREAQGSAPENKTQTPLLYRSSAAVYSLSASRAPFAENELWRSCPCALLLCLVSLLSAAEKQKGPWEKVSLAAKSQK